MNKIKILTLLIILLSFVIAFWLYPIMPEIMPFHWNASGVVNGHMPKLFALFLMPVIGLFCFILFIKIPDFDPKKKNIESFRKYYDYFILIFTLFLFYLYVLTILFTLNAPFNMTFMLIPAFAVLFFYLGILCKHAKQNWFIGIRTPWTLSSKVVWNKTHKVAARGFKIVAILCLIGMLFIDYAIWFILLPVILVAIYSFWYSYREYKNQQDPKKERVT